MPSAEELARIREACERDGFCWRLGDLRLKPSDLLVHYDYWTVHESILWRGCVPFARFDGDTGALVPL